MAESFYAKLGRIIHDLQIVNTINTIRMQYGNVTTGPDQTLIDLSTGYTRQQDTLYKQLVKRIFSETNKGNIIQVKNAAFTIVLPQTSYGVMSISFPAGIVDNIYMGVFPFETTVTVTHPGKYPMVYPNTGAIHSTRPRTKGN